MAQSKQRAVNAFAEKIRNARNNEVVEGRLSTSERVLKRVTDGIYRQPSSALRELISNAYDADATIVEIQTDPPRFGRIVVRDDGNGLTAEALSYLIHNIGGSAKRTAVGSDIGVCSGKDRACSPGGRKLIGKIGIGLFSVSQLTKEFQIITKTKGDPHRTIADVVLHTHSEDVGDDPDQDFATGTVKIWKVPAADPDNHGTEVILRNLLQKTRHDLASRDMWLRCASGNGGSQEGTQETVAVSAEPPAFHIGCVCTDIPNEIHRKPRLPWNASDNAQERFLALVKGMQDLRGNTNKNPSIYDHLDYYLRMLWVLSLSAPLDYAGTHPFDLGAEKGLRVFQLGNGSGSQATELSLPKGVTIRKTLGLISPERGGTSEFRVIVDGVQLCRPIQFRDLPKTLEAVPFSLLFVGKDSPDLSSYSEEVRGGDLEFEAYFLWNHTVVPKEHAGVLLRVNDSAGTLFDDTFMDYPVSEQRRKDQVTAEIFVTRGLDAALNIDRESFNYAHPHYQYLTRWVHNAFRQFATRHKAIAKDIREDARDKKAEQGLQDLDAKVDLSLSFILRDRDAPRPVVEFTDDSDVQAKKRKAGVLAFTRSGVFGARRAGQRVTQDRKLEETRFEAQIAALAKILDVYGVFENMPYEKQQRLLHDIVAIFSE